MTNEFLRYCHPYCPQVRIRFCRLSPQKFQADNNSIILKGVVFKVRRDSQNNFFSSQQEKREGESFKLGWNFFCIFSFLSHDI